MQDNPYAKYAQPQAGARPVYRQAPPQAAPRHPDQERRARNEAVASDVAPAMSAAELERIRLQNRQIELQNEQIALQQQTGGSKGQESLDQKFADDYAQWRLTGQSDASKALKQLRSTAEDLRTKNLTGPVIGMMPDWLNAIFNPESVDKREQVEEVAQRNLRAILGGQFAAREGEQLIARAYNPKLPESVNRTRVLRLMDQMIEAAEQKEAAARYFEQNGTLKGWQGKLWSVDDFDPAKGPGATIGADGNADYSAMQGGGTQTPVDPGADFRTEPNPEGNALIDQLVRQGVPYTAAVKQFRQAFPGSAPFAPKEYNDALKHFQSNPGFSGSYGGAVRTVPLSEREQSDNRASQSGIGAFAGHFADASLGGLPSAAAGDQGAFWRATTQQQNPGLSMAGDIGGAVAGTLGIGKGLGLLAPKAGPLLSTPGRQAFAADSLYGGTFGATQNPDDPLTGAMTGAAAMGAGNIAGRYALGPGIAAAGNSRVGQRALGMFGAKPAPALAASDRMIMGQAGNQTDDILGNLDEAASLNLPYSLADSNPQLRVLAGSATRKSPAVRELAENTIGPRQMGQSERAIGAIDQHLAPVGDLGQITTGATQRARDASRPLYEKAFSQPAPDIVANAKLGEVLTRPTSEAALRRAYTSALDEGVNPAELSIHIAENGKPILTGNPTWQTLHYVRRGLDDEIGGAVDPVTGKIMPGMGHSHSSMIKLRKDLDAEIGRLNPDFKAADAEYAKFAQQGSAATMGAKATSPRVTPETVQGVTGGMGDNLPFYQQGYASSMADRVENLGMTSDPYKAVYGSPAQRSKVGTLFPEGASRFDRINSLEGDMSKTAYETLGGSPTAARAQADTAFDGPGGLAGDVAFAAATGAPPPSLIGRGLTAARDTWRMGAGRKRADEIGPALLNTDPAASASFMRELVDSAAARREYMLRSRAAGGMFAAPFALPFAQ